jgi:hypothetical protein
MEEGYVSDRKEYGKNESRLSFTCDGNGITTTPPINQTIKNMSVNGRWQVFELSRVDCRRLQRQTECIMTEQEESKGWEMQWAKRRMDKKHASV